MILNAHYPTTSSATIIENEAARMQRREELKKRAGERKAKREQRMRLKRINGNEMNSELRNLFNIIHVFMCAVVLPHLNTLSVLITI